MLLMIPVKISDNIRDGTTFTDDASAGSLAQHSSTQPALHTALSARSMQVSFSTQHREECLSSATRSARITDRGTRSASSDALTDAIHRSALWYVW